MEGTCLGNFIAANFTDRLLARLKPSPEALVPVKCDRCGGTGKTFTKWDPCKDCRGAGFTSESDDVCPTCKGAGKVCDPEQYHDCYTCNGKGTRIPADESYYGLTFHDPNYDPGKAIIGKDCSDRTLTLGEKRSDGLTVEEAEAQGVSIGLERYQAIYAASSKYPTERHTIPSIDGACGFSSVEKIGKAIGLELVSFLGRHKSDHIYILHVGK